MKQDKKRVRVPKSTTDDSKGKTGSANSSGGKSQKEEYETALYVETPDPKATEVDKYEQVRVAHAGIRVCVSHLVLNMNFYTHSGMSSASMCLRKKRRRANPSGRHTTLYRTLGLRSMHGQRTRLLLAALQLWSTSLRVSGESMSSPRIGIHRWTSACT